VSCLFYFLLLSRFFQRKNKNCFFVGFIVFFKWASFKKPMWVFLGQVFLQQPWYTSEMAAHNFCSVCNETLGVLF